MRLSVLVSSGMKKVWLDQVAVVVAFVTFGDAVQTLLSAATIEVIRTLWKFSWL